MKQIGKKRGRGMIELDDAGGGCPIGGVAFAARRVETNEARTVYQTIQLPTINPINVHFNRN